MKLMVRMLFFWFTCVSLAQTGVILPHIAANHGWESQLVLDNHGYQQETVLVNIYADSVQTGTESYLLEPGERRVMLLSDGNCGTLDLPEKNVSARIVYRHLADGGIAEFRLNTSHDFQQVFLLSPFRSPDLTWAGIAIMNTGSTPTTATLTAEAEDGSPLDEVLLELGAMDRTADLIDDLFPGLDWTTVARVTAVADQPLAGVTISGNRNERLLFTPAISPNGNPDTCRIPHIPENRAYWDAYLVLDNLGEDTAACNLALQFRSETILEESLMLTAGEHRVIPVFTETAEPMDSGILTGCPETIAARISYVFRQTGGMAEFKLANHQSSAVMFGFPDAEDPLISWRGLALQNTSDVSQAVVLKAFRDGTEVDRELVRILPGHRFVTTLNSLFPLTAPAGIDRIVALGTDNLTGLNISGQLQERYLFTQTVAHMDNRTFDQRLMGLPGVTVTELAPADKFARNFQLDIEQLVDHTDPLAGTFIQTIRINHLVDTAPTVMYTGGYMLRTNRVLELATLLAGNQVLTGHRYFTGARPADPDWTHMTIRQAAGDTHHMIALLREIYPGLWITTGASKGGMTSLFHRYFHDGDVDASVAYVAPILLDLPDQRFTDFMNTTAGTEPCRNALRAFQRRLLNDRSNQIPWIRSYAGAYGQRYSRIPLDVAFEYMVMEYPVAFWQYGADDCDRIPAASASSQEMALHLLQTLGFLYSDNNVQSYEPFYYQAVTQFGYYSFMTETFQDLLVTVPEPSWTTFAPVGVATTYDPTVMPLVLTWLQQHGDRILYVYGGNDPWTSCAVELTGEADAFRFDQPGTNHGVKIVDLTERQQAYDALSRWLGITVPVSPAAELSAKAATSGATRGSPAPNALLSGQ